MNLIESFPELTYILAPLFTYSFKQITRAKLFNTNDAVS